MSLTDALLLDPYPFEIWIAQRTDGHLGSGRIDDPFDGSTVHQGAKEVTSIARSGNPNEFEANATTNGSHGYSNGDYIRISGITGANARYYNGTFLIYGASGSVFKYRMIGKPDSDVSGSFSAAKVLGYRFDDVMRSLPANVTVRIGPGVFETMGLMPTAAASDRWEVKSDGKSTARALARQRCD